jgi:hypothetical protein
MSRWITPQAAFNRLLPFHNGNGWTVGEILNDALRKNDLRLRRNGVLLSPADIRDEELYVRVDLARDGRWTCTIASRLPAIVPIIDFDDDHDVQMVRAVWPPPPKWEVNDEGIEALLLLLSADNRTRGVHQPAWRVQTEEEIQRLARTNLPLLENFRALYQHIENHLKVQGIRRDTNKSRFHKAIRDYCEKYR